MPRHRIHLAYLTILAASVLAFGAVQGETILLKPVAIDQTGVPRLPRWVRLDEKNRGEMRFAMPSGKLRFQLEPNGLVRIDRNDDGTFDEKDLPLVDPRQPTTVDTRSGAEALNYRLRVTVSGNDDERGLRVTSLTAREATCEFGRLRILDGNCNGRFDDLLGDDPDSDLVHVGEDTPVPLQQYLARDGKLTRIEVLEGGQTVRLSAYTGPAATFAPTVKPGFAFTTTLIHKESGYTVETTSEHPALTLPGTHQLTQVTLHSLPGKEADADKIPALALDGCDGLLEIELKEGLSKPAFGPPFNMEFRASRSPKDPASVEVRDLWLTGAGGERYAAHNTKDEAETAPQCLLRNGDKTVVASQLGYG